LATSERLLPSSIGPNPAADAARAIPQFDIVAVHQGPGLFDGFLVTTASDDIRRVYNVAFPINRIDTVLGHVGFPSSAMMGQDGLSRQVSSEQN
jgi:hypothetical protein